MNYTSGNVVANGIKLHYYRTGKTGSQPLVLVHGITDDGLCWTPVTEVFKDSYDVIMVDMRGHGQSEAPEDGYTLKNLGEDLAQLIQALELEKTIILGHSLGAVAALLFAGMYPELPQMLLLEDPPPFWDEDFFSVRNVSFEEWIVGIKEKAREEIVEEGHTTNPVWSEAEIEPWADSKLRFDVTVKEFMNPKDYLSIDFPSLLKQIKCSLLLISGNKQLGAASTKDDIARLKSELPQLDVVYIEDAGHSIRREQFDQYTAVLKQYL